jgi:hypothetical protein
MKTTVFPWWFVGALSGLTFGVVSSFYSQWQMDEFNRTQKEKYQQDRKNGMRSFFESKDPSPNKTEERAAA